jgi:hypothetical protein
MASPGRGAGHRSSRITWISKVVREWMEDPDAQFDPLGGPAVQPA